MRKKYLILSANSNEKQYFMGELVVGKFFEFLNFFKIEFWIHFKLKLIN